MPGKGGFKETAREKGISVKSLWAHTTCCIQKHLIGLYLDKHLQRQKSEDSLAPQHNLLFQYAGLAVFKSFVQDL